MTPFDALVAGVFLGLQMSRDSQKTYERERKQRLRQMSRDKEESLSIYTNTKHTVVSRDIGLSEAFDRFWLAYPKREGPNPKKPAREKFFRLAKSGTDPEKLIRGAETYSRALRAANQIGTRYVCMATTWLNQARWEDEQPADNVMSPEEFKQKMREYEERKQREREEARQARRRRL